MKGTDGVRGTGRTPPGVELTQQETDPAVGRGHGGKCLRKKRQAAVCTSGLWVPFCPLQGDTLDTPPSPRDAYLRAQPGRPAWPERLSSSPPSPHLRPHPGKTKPAGNSLAVRSVCSSEPCGAPTSSMCPRMDTSACQRGLWHQSHLGTC